MADRINTACFELQQPQDVADGTEFFNCNFAQQFPATELTALMGKTIKFENCNLTNVAVDPAWTLDGCNLDEVEDYVAAQEQAMIPPEPTLEEYIERAPESIREELQTKAQYYDAAVTAGTIADFKPKREVIGEALIDG